MFRQNSILSELDGAVISIGTRTYIGQRAKNSFYDYVMTKFRHSNISKAELARRIGKGPAQINRMLATPGNWTIETIAELLAGMSAEELLPWSAPFTGRPKSNHRQEDDISSLACNDDIGSTFLVGGKSNSSPAKFLQLEMTP